MNALKTISIFDFSRHKIIEERKEYLEKLNIHRENEEKRKAAEALAEQQKLEEVHYYFPSLRNLTLQIYFFVHSLHQHLPSGIWRGPSLAAALH